MAFSYWESTEWFEDADLVIIGAGFVGLSAAIHSKKLNPKGQIIVIERDPIGGGGSSKNAGFACFGSTSELQEDRLALGDEQALLLVQKRWQGLAQLRSLLGDDAIDYDACGSLELFRTHSDYEPLEEAALAELNEWIAPVTGSNRTFIPVPLKDLHSLHHSTLTGAIYSPLEGALNAGKMLKALESKAIGQGIRIIRGCEVTNIDLKHDVPSLTILRPPADELHLRPSQVIVATNAFTSSLLPQIEVLGKSNLVLVTAPIPNFEFGPTVHMDAGYLYARSIGQRMLIGGGRHWGMEDEQVLREELQKILHAIWPQTAQVKIEYSWHGTLGIGAQRLPIIQRLHPKCVVAARLGGMGVAMGIEVGKQASELAH